MGIGPGIGFYPLVIRFPPIRQWELDRAQVCVFSYKISTYPAMGIGPGTGFCPLVIRFPPVWQWELDWAQVSILSGNGNWTGHRFLSFSYKVSTCLAMGIGPGTGFCPLVIRFPSVRQWELDQAQVSVL